MPFKNSELQRVYKQKWYLYNRERILKIRRKRYKLKRISVIRYVKAWVAKNRDKVRINHRRWEANNPHKTCANAAKKRACRKAAILGNQLLVQTIYTRAKELREWFDVVVDHIIPLAEGGAHSAENLQIIYSYENAIKGSRLNYKPKVIFK